MVTGRLEAEWDRTSVALAMFANAHRDKKKRAKPWAPRDFNPMIKKKRTRIGSFKDVPGLKGAFEQMKKKKRTSKR